jgi:catechol 2,3-dioxygenase-like lactoylglutathione lyase family enzyme
MAAGGYRLEVVQVPVSDLDRALAFYRNAMGFAVDHDTVLGEGVRMVQLTPPESACSIHIGTGLSDMVPGSLRGLLLAVDDIEAARDDLRGRGVDTGEVRELGAPGRSAFRFLFLSDPDGNTWAVQELPRS